jgi:hypothetical protein
MEFEIQRSKRKNVGSKLQALKYIDTRTPFYLGFREDGDLAPKHVVLKPT